MKFSLLTKGFVITTSCVLFLLSTIRAQNNSDQNSLTSSPTTSGLASQSASVGLASGAAQFSVPLYEVKCGSLSLPISASYSYNGLQTMQEASWVGLGWNLLAGGVISRNIQGNIDGSRVSGRNYTQYSVQDSLFQGNNAAFLQLLYDNSTQNSYDGAPDVFTCNFNGYSGSFYWYKGKAYLLTYDKEFKVNWTDSAGPVTITTGDGVAYIFGVAETYVSRFFPRPTNFNYISAFYLNTVISADKKDTISLNYEIAPWKQYSFLSNNFYVQGTYDALLGKDSTTVNTPVLSFISCRNTSITFTKSANARTDVQGAQPYLQEMDVTDPISGHLIKKIAFTYGYFGGNIGGVLYGYQRLKLKTCSIVNPANTADQQTYQFSYLAENNTDYPGKGNDMDPWGFYSPDIFPPFYQDDYYRYPNFAHSSYGAMDTVTAPTGGYSVFEYEPNDYDSSSGQHYAPGPGIRVKAISQYLPGSVTPAKRVSYSYLVDNGLASSGVLVHDSITAGPLYIRDTLMFNKYVLNNSDPGDQTRSNQLYYSKVTEQTGTANERYRSDYYFQSFSNSFPDVELVKKISYLYDAATNVYKPQVVTSSQFTTVIDTTFLSLYAYIDSSYLNPNGNELTYKYGYAYTNHNTYWKHLVSQQTVQYDIQGDSMLTSTRYHYNSLRNLDSSIQTMPDGRTVIQRLKHADDYTSGVTGNMVAAHVVDPVLEKQTWIKSGAGAAYMIAGQITQYDQTLFKPVSLFSTETVAPITHLDNEAITGTQFSTLLSDTSHYRLKAQMGYDGNNNLSQSNKASDISTTYLYDYHHSIRVAEIHNATPGQVAYSSFEADDLGGWVVISSTVTADPTSPTGGKCLVLTGGNVFKTGVTPGLIYVVSYWSKNGPYSVTGSSSKTTGKTINGWTYYEHKVTGVTSVSVTGTGSIDELRLYPQDALMTTYTYNPLIGICTKCDPDNRVTYYFYDSLGRLRYVKDQDKNIVQTLDYHLKNGF